MGNSKKVVQINGQREDAADSRLFARLPAPFAAMKERGNLSLQPLLQALFDNIDDALFELADKAEHNSEQNMYFESMREVRIKRRGMELGFNREVNETFRQLVNVRSTAPQLSDQDKATSIDQLALVENDELEELVASDSMIAKAASKLAVPLFHLTTRLNTLVTGVTITDTNNPFGPSAICRAFISVCSDLELDIKAKLVLFKLFDRFVMNELNTVYDACNSVLVDAGVLPKLDSSSSRNKQPKATEQSSNTTYSDVFADLQKLLHQAPQTQAPAASGLAAPGAAPALPQDTLLQFLQRIQMSQLTVLEHQQQKALRGQVPEQIDIQRALNNLLMAEMPAQKMSMGQVDHDAINLVAMLFQFVLDDRNLAAPMKALIARLQIPIIKVAMLDKSFFSKGGHPARKLLNEIAHASIGWMQTDNLERDPLYSKVSYVVNRLLSEFEGDVSLFDEMLTEFLAFLEVDQRRSGLVAQRTVNAEDGKAKTELARTRVQNVLNEKVAGKSLPKVVITLLEEAWSNVLFLIYLKDGEEKNWKSALKVVDELLWSVEPMEDACSRQRLLKMVPSLLKNLRAGLTKIAYNPFDMNKLFADLEMIHLEQLKDLNASTTKPAAAKPGVDHSRTSQRQTLDEMLDERSKQDASLKQLDAELADFDALEDTVAAKVDEPTATEHRAENGIVESGVVENNTAGNKVAENNPVGNSAAEKNAAGNNATENSVVENKVVERQIVDKIVVNGAAGTEPEQITESELPEDDPDLQRVDAMTMGNWVELLQPDGKKFRCRLAAVIRSIGKHIFVNRSGMKVAEYDRQSLARALKSGAVTTIDDGLLFDRALESVIGSLRKMNPSKP